MDYQRQTFPRTDQQFGLGVEEGETSNSTVMVEWAVVAEIEVGLTPVRILAVVVGYIDVGAEEAVRMERKLEEEADVGIDMAEMKSILGVDAMEAVEGKLVEVEEDRHKARLSKVVEVRVH